MVVKARWTSDGPMAKHANDLLENRVVFPDTPARQVYNDHMSVFGGVTYETFRRHWNKVKNEYLVQNTPSIQPVYDPMPPDYDPNERVTAGPNPVVRRPVASHRSQTPNTTPNNACDPPSK